MILQGKIVMAKCGDLQIPDDNWTLQAISYIGGLLGIDIFRDTIPRLIIEQNKACKPDFMWVQGSIVDCLITGFSLYYTMNLMFSGTMKSLSSLLGGYIVGNTVSFASLIYILFPCISVLVYYSLSKTQDNRDKDLTKPDIPEYILFGIIVGSFILLFVIVPGIVTIFHKDISIGDMFLFILFTILLSSVSKYVLPVLLLLLGPGSIPAMFGKSYLDFCVE